MTPFAPNLKSEEFKKCRENTDTRQRGRSFAALRTASVRSRDADLDRGSMGNGGAGFESAPGPLPTKRPSVFLLHAVALSVILSLGLWIRLHPIVSNPEEYRRGLGPFGDTQLYHRIAYNLYQGHGFSGTDDGRAIRARHRQHRPGV